MIANLAIIALFVYAAYAGTKRGFILVGLELITFFLATGLALLTYHLLGALIKDAAGISLALGDVAAFTLIWIITEIVLAILMRWQLLPRIPHGAHTHQVSRIAGGVLDVLKSAMIVMLSLVVFVTLPITSGLRNAVTNATIPSMFLATTGTLQRWVNAGIGHDIGDSLNFFTVTASPESEQRIELGYTTTKVTVDPSDEDAMLVLLNHERAIHNLPPLKLNPKARAVARAYSADMFARGYFSHISPEGKNPFDRMHAGGVTFGSAGENLALAPTLQLAHQGLMNSPGHRANILSKSFHTVGIGIMDGGTYGLMVTQDFTD